MAHGVICGRHIRIASPTMPRQNSLFLSNWISFSLKALELDHLFLLATRTKQHYALPLTVSTYVLSPLLSVGAGNYCILQPLLGAMRYRS